MTTLIVPSVTKAIDLKTACIQPATSPKTPIKNKAIIGSGLSTARKMQLLASRKRSAPPSPLANEAVIGKTSLSSPLQKTGSHCFTPPMLRLDSEFDEKFAHICSSEEEYSPRKVVWKTKHAWVRTVYAAYDGLFEEILRWRDVLCDEYPERDERTIADMLVRKITDAQIYMSSCHNDMLWSRNAFRGYEERDNSGLSDEEIETDMLELRHHVTERLQSNCPLPFGIYNAIARWSIKTKMEPFSVIYPSNDMGTPIDKINREKILHL